MSSIMPDIITINNISEEEIYLCPSCFYRLKRHYRKWKIQNSEKQYYGENGDD